MQLRAETTVDAEKLLVHDRSQRQRTEGFHASFINPLSVFVLTLELEGEVVGQMSTFMVAPQKPQGIRVPNLESPQVKDALAGDQSVTTTTMGEDAIAHLDTEVASVHVVTEEQVSCLCRVSADLKQLHEIVILSMDVTADRNRSIHLQEVWLGAEQLSAGVYDPQRLLFREPPLPVEMLLEKLEIGLGRVLLRPEGVVVGCVEGGRLHL